MEVAKANRHGRRDATMVLLAYRHGLRASELVDLLLRHACGYALANKGQDTRALQAYLGHRKGG
jgi:site-specific recombinase XerD